MSEEQKVSAKKMCACGANVLAKNFTAHQKSKKHLIATGEYKEPVKKTTEVAEEVQNLDNASVQDMVKHLVEVQQEHGLALKAILEILEEEMEEDDDEVSEEEK